MRAREPLEVREEHRTEDEVDRREPDAHPDRHQRVAPIGWVLSPYWGMRAVRESALGGDPLVPIGMCVGLAAVYLVLGAAFLANFERLARKHATLSLT